MYFPEASGLVDVGSVPVDPLLFHIGYDSKIFKIIASRAVCADKII